LHRRGGQLSVKKVQLLINGAHLSGCAEIHNVNLYKSKSLAEEETKLHYKKSTCFYYIHPFGKLCAAYI
jgi:hypothetical protein